MTQNLVLHVNSPNGLVLLQVQTAINEKEVFSNLAVAQELCNHEAGTKDQRP